MTATELRRRAAELREKILATINAAEGEDRELNEDETAQVDEWRADAEKLERRAKVVEAAEAAVGDGRQLQPRVSAPLSGGSGIETDRIEGVRGGAEGDKTRSFGDFLATVIRTKDTNLQANDRESARNRLTNLYRSQYRDYSSGTPEKRALAASIGSAGGHTIPPDFYRGIMQVAGEDAIVRPRATVIPMVGLSIPIPMLNQTGTPPTGGSAFFGGMALRWTGEQEDKPETEPTFKQGTLEAHELSGITKVSRVLLMKSPLSIDGILFNLFGRAVGWMEDQAFLLGASPTRPKGVLTSAALVKTAARGSASAISFANITDVFVKAIAQSQGKGVFVASQAAQSAVLKATGTAGSVFIPAGLVPITPDGQRGAAANMNIGAFARPILFSEKLPALNTLGDFGFYDFENYLIGDPDMAMEIATSEHVGFTSNQITFRLIHYVAGMPWLDAAFTLADGTTTVSPFAALEIQ